MSSKPIPLPKDSVSRQLRLNIEHLGEWRGIDAEGQALVMQMCPATYAARRRNPDNFTVGELKRIAKKYGVPITDLFGASPYVK